jgi:Transposase DDE domain
MQGEPLRELEWAPPKEATLLLPIPDPTPAAYGPWQLAGDGGRAHGQIAGGAFVWQEDGKLRCPTGANLWLSEVRQENAFTQRAVYLAYSTDCQPCPLREQCLAKGGQRQPGSSGQCGAPPLAPAFLS